MHYRPVVAVVAMAVIAACGANDDGDPRSSTQRATTTTGAVDIVERLALPDEGVVVQDTIESGIRFVALDGEVVATKPDWSIDYRWVPPEPPRLRTPAGAVVTTDAAHDALVDDDPVFVPEGADDRADLPHPQPIGHWQWEIVRADGRIAAQWSGECEIPIAYGFASRSAPAEQLGEEAFALGWAADGRAVVHFQPALCGEQGHAVGVFLVDDNGESEAIVAGAVSEARFWSTD